MAEFNTLNYYEILEVEANSSVNEIKSSYRKLARKYHPDINKNSDAIDKFKMITLAYETLSNPTKREQYNILNGIFKEEKTNTSQSQTYTATPKYSQNSDKSSQNEKISFVKAIKYYIAKFRKNRKAQENKKPQKGQNITTEVKITPEEVISGSKRIINILTTQTCPKCSGHRFINGGKCDRCKGTGEISTRKKITVTIPKGIKNGAKLRIKKEGASGKNGGSNGDLIINIKIEIPQKIQYEKLNIYYNLPITPYEAALGEEIKIPVVDGNIKLKLPKNTCSGQKFRLSGQGIKKNGKVGDLIVTVSIEFSHDLSEDEIKLYEKLKNLSKDDLRKNFINEGKN